MATSTKSRERGIQVIDGTDVPMGRLATRVATLLMGKHKTGYLTHVDDGDFVHVKHIGKMKLSGKKAEQKTYKWYTGYQGGLRERAIKDVLAKDPTDALRRAVKNMLPKNKHQVARMRRLRVTV